nr:PREDICTED: protein CASC5 [Balearica regulorum gibbericeps]
MDKIYTDPNLENDNTEHIRGKRLSSILKAPRNPLDDLGNGNELTQDINIEKRRKNSRRVSFANTINCRVFQRDLKNNTAETESTEMKNLKLFHVRSLWHDADNAIQRTHRHDTTLIFSDENEMEMTASHTAVITRNLKNNQADRTEKIDITSFLAGLNSNNEKAEMSKEFHFFSDPTNISCPSFEQKEDATTVKKINFNEFLMSLKSNEKARNPTEGPEKENVFFVPSQVPEDMAQSSVELVYSHEPLDTCNVTKVFRGQDDGMEMTKCQASNVKAMFSGICEAPPEQLLRADVTEAFIDDGMDMTTSHTAKMSFPFVDKKILNVEDRRDPTMVRTVKQEARTMSAIPGSVSSETVFRGEKTVVFSKCDDMEITGNYTDVIYNDSAKEMNSSHHKTFGKPVNTNPSLAEKRRPAHGERDTTKSLMSLDNRASLSYKNSALELSLGSGERTEKVTQDHGTASVNVGFESCTNSVSSGVSKGRLQHRQANSQLLALPGEKTVIFSGEDMDLTKACVVRDDGKNVENESLGGVFISVTCRPHSLDNTSTSPNLNEQEEMEITKCHAAVIDDQSNGIIAEAKQMHFSCTNDKPGMFSDDQSMDITKTHPAAFDVAPINTVQEYENNRNQNNVISKQLQTQTFQSSGSSGVDITSQTAAMERGDLKMNTNKQAVTPLAPNGSLISSNEPAPSGMKGNKQLGTILGINADCPNADRQEKPRTMKLVNKILPTQVDSERHFSIGKTVSSEVDFKNLLSADSLHLRGAEEPSLANTSEPHQGGSQLPAFSEKSVVFPSGENMDLTGNCAVMVPNHNVNAVLSERKAVPGYLVQDENKIIFFKKEVMMTNSQEQPACDAYSLESGKKTLTTTGLKHLPFAGEKTTIFSEDADMDITRSHTVSADKIILQCKSSNDDISLISGDKTCIFTYNDDMEISRLDTIAVDKSVEKAASQGMLNMAKRTGRKSLKGTTGEKTVLFSLNDENNDMEITQSHTAAIGHEIASQNEGGLHSVSSAHPVKTALLTGSQADMDIMKSCSADKMTVKVVCDDKLNLGREAGQQALSNSKATVFAVDDMEITETHNVALEENSLQGRQPNQPVPLTSTIMFTSYQADMEMTESHSVEGSIEGGFCEDRLHLARQVQQEAISDSKTVIFTTAEDMEITKTPTAGFSTEINVQDRVPIPATSAVPADKTIVFTHNQDDMEITASHTIAVNNNINGFENQEVSHESTQGPDLRSELLSSCRDEIDSSHTKDLHAEYHTKRKDKPSIPPSASSASAFPHEKGAVKVHSGTMPRSVYSVSLPEETMDVRAPQDLDLPTDTSVPVNSEQDLIPPENPKSKRVSFKLPSNRPTDCSEESGDLVSRVSLPIQQPDSLTGSPDTHSTRRNHTLQADSSRNEDSATDLSLAGANLVTTSNEESKENKGLSAKGETPPKDFQINSEQTKQLLVSDSPRDQIDPTLAPELSGILNVCSKLNNIRRKSVALSISETAFSDQLPKSSTQPENTLKLGKNTVNEPNNSFNTKEQENTCLEPGAAPMDANLGMTLKGRYQGINIPLGIFQPKLPNRRTPSVSSVQDINAKSSDKGEAPVSEVSVNAGETPGNQKSSRQNFSPSQFIAEEFLPVCLEEMDSNESVSSEFVENACNEISKKQISHNEQNQYEETKTCNNTKRALGLDEEDLQSPKKLKRDENLDGEACQGLQVTLGAVSRSQVEVHEGEDPPNLSAKSPDCTHASTSCSLDSVKADTELTIQRSSQMESQLLTDSICEDNLREKFQSGVITVGEFFTLLQVHVPIQKPRHSHLPANCAVSAPPTPEDLIYSQYVYRPKLRIYEEDCQALSQMIDELKQYANVQDQLLVNVNKSLWEVMRTCSDEELRSFGAELNKMKSYFTKESKILAHNEKVTLYSKLLQSAQEQHGKLQSRIEKVDELLKEAESCLVALEEAYERVSKLAESASEIGPGAGHTQLKMAAKPASSPADSDWAEREADCSDEMAAGKNLEEELESLKAQEEELQRELSDLETQNELMLAQMNELKEKEKSCQELLETYNFTEWEITEWSEQQAVFSFLYDSIELTVVFGPPIDGDVFGENPSRKIASLDFESLLDEEKAPPSSCLVQRLIFQFIESHGCWQEKCPTLCYLPQVLRDVSLVVSRCKILGEEIEFLERWGGKFNLLKTDISDTKVKLLFSASTAFAKFELALSLSANYPSASLPFTVQNQIGNIGEEEISAVLSNVPVGYHYLRRIVSLIHQNLLQDPR